MIWPDAFWPPRLWPRHFWGRSDGYRIYKRDAIDGPDTLVATVPPGTTEYVFTGAPDSVAWLHVRAANERGREDNEAIRPKLRRVAFGGDGALILPVPNAPTALHLQPTAEGGMTATWSYQTYAEEVAVDHFDLFVTTEALPFDYGTPDHQVNATGARQYTLELDPFVHDTLVRVVVRAVSAAGATETSTTEAEATADDTAPAIPDSLEAEVLDV